LPRPSSQAPNPCEWSPGLGWRSHREATKASFRELASQPDGGQGAGNAGLAAVSPPPAWPGFRPLAVTAIEPESRSVISLRLADPAGAALPAASPGQFLTVRLQPQPDQPPLLRSYSLSGPPDAGSYRISVKREQHGHRDLRVVGRQLPTSIRSRPRVTEVAWAGSWRQRGTGQRQEPRRPMAALQRTVVEPRPGSCPSGWSSSATSTAEKKKLRLGHHLRTATKDGKLPERTTRRQT
jgi:hypothetical protein